MDATVSIHISVSDKQALWAAAAANAVSSGSHETETQYKAEFDIDRVTDHLRFLVDRPLPQELGQLGFEIVDSYCEIDDENPGEITPESNAQIALVAVYNEARQHPEDSDRETALGTIDVIRLLLNVTLETIPDNAVGDAIDHLRTTYREVTTDVDGLPRDDANTLIKELAERLGPVVQHFKKALEASAE